MPMTPLFLLLLSLIPSAHPISFKWPTLNSTELLFEGDVAISTQGIELTNYRYSCRVGRVSYAQRVRLWDSNTGKLSDFSTHFSFIVDTLGKVENHGSGFVFFFAPFGFHIPPNSLAGFLGLFNKTEGDQIVAVEFDSYSNSDWDPPFEHVGINNSSLVSSVYTKWNSSFHSGDVADAWVNYNATTKNLKVSWAYRTTSNNGENNSLVYKIDLMKVLPEWVMVGFSASQGTYLERNILISWEFNSTLNDISEHKKYRLPRIGSVIVGLMSFALFLGSIIAFRLVWRKKQKQVAKEANESAKLASISNFEKGTVPRMFSYKDLASATRNFSGERKLGEGGFGSVYKGYIADLDIVVAVKKFSKGSSQGKKEYTTEVKVISQLRHRNLVQLLGWCHEKGEFLLVYEFMSNGSLDAHLFGKNSTLTWAMRHKITHGLASALLYLHEEWGQCVVHRDIKSSNIMLDSNFNVKLGDFGLARLMDHELTPKTTGLAGTLGYMAPEYIGTGRASKESDVYSFGVVVLEIATGKKSVNPLEQKSLVQWVWDLYGSDNLISGADKRLQMEFDVTQMIVLMVVGLWCAHPDCRSRPSIRQAIQVLNDESKLPNLAPKMPVPLFHLPGPVMADIYSQSSASSYTISY